MHARNVLLRDEASLSSGNVAATDAARPPELSALIVGPSSTAVTEMERLLASTADFAVTVAHAELADAERLLASSSRDVAVVVLDGDPEGAFTCIEQMHASRPALTVFAVATVNGNRSAYMIRAMRAGANEFMTWPIAPDDLGRALRKVTAIRAFPGPRADAGGQIWTVLGPKEGVGATTLVANLALELTRSGRSVVAVDLDFRCGDLALFLNVEPIHSLIDVAREFDRLDHVFLEGTLVRHHLGTSVLAAPPDPGCCEPGFLDGRQLGRVLELLRGAHDIVVVDAPPPLGDVSLAAVAASDRVLVPTEVTVPSLRATWRTIEALGAKNVRPRHLDIIATKYDERRADITLAEVRTDLHIPLDHMVPRDDEAACRAINSGLSLADVAESLPLRKAIVALAQTLAPSAEREKPRKRGLLGRLFES